MIVHGERIADDVVEARRAAVFGGDHETLAKH